MLRKSGQLIVPTLCVGMPQRTLCVCSWDAERPGPHSFAARGNDHGGRLNQCFDTQRVGRSRLAERHTGGDQQRVATLGHALRLGDFQRRRAHLIDLTQAIIDHRVNAPRHAQTACGLQVRRQVEDRRFRPLPRCTQARRSRLAVVDQHRDRQHVADAADRAADRIGNGRFSFRPADVELGLVVRAVFHLTDDLAHHLHRFERVFTGGGFRRQHHRIGAFGHGVGHIGDFRAGWRRGETHRFEHLRRDHHRFTEFTAGGDDVFLNLRHAFGRDFHAKVAASHHDRVAQFGDFAQLFNRRRLLDFRHQEGFVADQFAGFEDVLRTLHERQRHPVHPQFQAEAQVAAILGRQRAQVEHRLRHVDAFAVGQFAAGEHSGVDRIGVLGDHTQTQFAVIQQQIHTRFQRSNDLWMRQIHPALIARRGVQIETEGLTAMQLHLAVGELADAQFRPLQVHQNAQRIVELALDFADPLIALGVVGMIAVAEVQAEDVHPGLDQFTDVFDAIDSGPEGGEDFDLFIRRHDLELSRIRMARKSLTLV
eukprot:Opistho-2@13292